MSATTALFQRTAASGTLRPKHCHKGTVRADTAGKRIHRRRDSHFYLDVMPVL
jgi:hypothetical protein